MHRCVEDSRGPGLLVVLGFCMHVARLFALLIRCRVVKLSARPQSHAFWLLASASEPAREYVCLPELGCCALFPSRLQLPFFAEARPERMLALSTAAPSATCSTSGRQAACLAVPPPYAAVRSRRLPRADGVCLRAFGRQTPPPPPPPPGGESRASTQCVASRQHWKGLFLRSSLQLHPLACVHVMQEFPSCRPTV